MGRKNVAFQGWGICLLLVICALTKTVAAQEPENLRVTASIFPPYSFEENGVVKGVAVDRVKKALGSVGLFPDIELYPWARALYTVKHNPNTVLFSVARSPEREMMFRWIGPVIDFNVHVYRRADRTDIHVNHRAALKNYSFAGLQKDIKTSFLKKLGVDVYDVSLEEKAIKMLNAGRVDLIASDINAMEYRLKELGLEKEKFVSILPLNELSKPLYLVANRNTSPELIKKLRRALKADK